MNDLITRHYGDFFLHSTVEKANLPALVRKFVGTATIAQKGTGGIKIFSIEGVQLACRKYVHGGLLRAITGDIFLTESRAIGELKTLLYLEEEGFPVVHPYGVLVHRGSFAKKLHIITVFVDNASTLLDVLMASGSKERLRLIRKLAVLFRDLEVLGVYNPDLHLNNVLVTKQKELIFLDFDKACRKKVTGKDMEHMFWRLNRFVKKWEQSGEISLSARDRVLFLRTYARLSGCDLEPVMAQKISRKTILAKVGWFIESLLYGHNK